MLLCYLAQNGKKSTIEISQKWDFNKKNFWSLFTAVFFDFFSKNCQKVKVTNLTKNGQNYQILLDICFLRSLDSKMHVSKNNLIILAIFGQISDLYFLTIFGKKIEKNSNKKWPKFFFIKISFLGNLSCGFFSILSQITK